MTEANAEQSTFWNAQPGQNWVAFQPQLDAHHTEVTDCLLAACAPRSGEKVLDIGCGAGGSTFALAAATGATGSVLGLDISIPLLARAEERRRELALGNVRFTVGDAQDHPFAPAGFDLAASRFGVMFFADPIAAFRNIARALRPGGRLVFVAWAGPEHNPFFTVPQRAAANRLGPIAPSPPDAPGPMAFRDAGRVTGLLEAAGLREVRAEPIDLGLPNPDGLDAVVAMVGSIGALPRVMRETAGTTEDLAAILAAVRAEFAAFATPSGVRIPARVLVYSARA